MLHVFRLSLEKGIFPDDLKIAKVMGAFKAGDENEFGNYRPISILPCFSKIFERIMYKRLYNHLLNQNILYRKQFGFQQGHSTEHAILLLIDQINYNFEKNYFTLGVFIGLSKAFDTVDHQILISKLNDYGIEGNNLNWFKNYLQKCKQYLILNKYETSFGSIKCGVSQGSILGPLLFLIYVNDLCNASDILDPIMFADDTNLFLSHQNITILFNKFNEELQKIETWFKANKLSLIAKKLSMLFFIKVLPKMKYL